MDYRLTITRQVAWSVLKYLLLAAVAGAVLVMLLLTSAYGDLKSAASKGLSGKTELSQAIYAAQANNWTKALNGATQAQQDFSSALENLDRTHDNPAVKYFGFVRTQIDDLEYLLKTAEILSRSLEHIVPIAQGLDRIRSGAVSKNFNDLPAADKDRFIKMIYESEPEITGLKANLDLALLNLDKIHQLGILWPIYGKISNVKQELTQTAKLMAKASPVIKLLPALTGYPESSRFLLIMQNNDELRPTGGFIGVYGILETKSGEIVSVKTDDSYHVDMPASLTNKWNLEPPAPLKKYLAVEKWYLRDANWSPDWALSAKKITEIYNGEIAAVNGTTTPFTGIIGITPNVVSNLIKLVGPITVRGVTYNADNLQPLLQYNVEVAYKDQNISSWDRKEVINELLTELKQRLFVLPANRWNELITVLDNAVATRDLQLYFDNASWESLARNLGASGELIDTDSDYLMTVDANLGAFKSDVVVKKDLSYNVASGSGGLNASLKFNYQHEGGFDWRTTRYRSYTRVYAPLGSRLISLSGLDSSSADLSADDDRELNKTVFGFFLTVEPGSSREVVLDYRLPDYIYRQFNQGNYKLLVQRQAGQRIDALNVSIKPLKGKALGWNTNLDNDRYFSVK